MSNNSKLLSLIRFGLGLDSHDHLQPMPITESEWESIFTLAMEQAVPGIVFASTENYPQQCLIPRKLLFQWVALVDSIEEANIRLDTIIGKIVCVWNKIGVQPIIVKGQVVAREYGALMPMRSAGDIDVFFIPSQWNAVMKWIEANGLDYKSHSAEKHIELVYEGVSLELHHHLNVFSSSVAQYYWINEIESKAMENCRVVDIAGCPVKTLGLSETLVYLTIHIHHHLLTEGIGLRQFIDLALFLNNHLEEIDPKAVQHHLEGIGHYNAFTAYCALMCKYLGLNSNKIPFALKTIDYEYADCIMSEVWQGGNFGHKNNLTDVKPGLLHSLNTAILVFKHAWRFYRLAPAEARGYWWHKVFWRMQRKQ